ncbi:hypothetical protein SH2C18_36630 [Clostridium sediminicola]|uniref:hypothetical protein n=1 Tax=Clostridium sediminicola TaxID=3114879 RepID=UPI0031F1E81D
MKQKRFQHNFKSYLWVIGIGLFAGIITRLSDLFPYDTLWSFSSIASAFGFWMLTTTLVIYFSCSNKNAAINVFLYLSSMNFSFYFLKYIIGFYFPRFYDIGGFHWTLLIEYDIFALVCAAISYVLYFWNKDNKISNVLYALPICGLGAETIGIAMFLANTHTYLFQLIFDLLSFMILGYIFYKKVNSKLIYIITVIIGTLSGYYLVYASMI